MTIVKEQKNKRIKEKMLVTLKNRKIELSGCPSAAPGIVKVPLNHKFTIP